MRPGGRVIRLQLRNGRERFECCIPIFGLQRHESDQEMPLDEIRFFLKGESAAFTRLRDVACGQSLKPSAQQFLKLLSLVCTHSVELLVA